jgi:release factor glutamine methyltransferase
MLARQFPDASVGGSDLSESAVNLARQNLVHLGLSSRVEFRTGDLSAPFRNAEWAGKVDLLTCNPPYISSAKVPAMASEIANFEPSMAFDGGPFGVSILMRLLQEAKELIRPGGWLAFEVGLGQGAAMTKRLTMAGGFSAIEHHLDKDGQIRAISARLTQGTTE